MGHQVVWEKVAVYDQETGEDTIVNRGEMLPTEGVDEFQLGVLTSIGAVAYREDVPSKVDYAAVALDPDQDKGRPSPPPAGLPPSYPARQMNSGDEPDKDPDMETGDEPPANSAPKESWVAYATKRGMSEPEAKRLSKEALINRFGTK